jgi:hypothetical protein
MVARVFGVVLIGVAPFFAGCGSDSTPPPPPAPAAPKVSDEDQVRDVLTKEGEAFSAWDIDKVAGLTCKQYRDESASVDEMVPPMDMFPAAESAAIGADNFAALLGQQFTGATPESLHAVADAVIRQDQPAYRSAMLEVVKQVYTIRLEKIENIVVNGDTATAETTISQGMGSEAPQSEVTTVTLVREDGEWKDCTPPSKS